MPTVKKHSAKSKAKKKAPATKLQPSAGPAKAVAEKPEKPEAKPTTSSQKHATIRKPRVVVGFIDFLREQSVVGLAIGLVIGAQVKALADQLINSFINPLLGLLLPGAGSLNNKSFSLHLEHKTAVFAWGAFVAVLLSFLTTAAVVYVVFKALKLDTLTKKK